MNNEKKLKFNIENEVREYEKFAFNNNLINMAVALVMGNAIQKVVTSLSSGFFMPIINYFINKTGTSWRNWEIIPVKGMRIEIGELLGSSIDFIIISVIMYVLYVKFMKKFIIHSDESEKKC